VRVIAQNTQIYHPVPLAVASRPNNKSLYLTYPISFTQMVQDDEIVSKVKDILAAEDPASLTLKIVIKKLQEIFSEDLKDKKKFIKKTIQELMASSAPEAGEEESEPPKKENTEAKITKRKKSDDKEQENESSEKEQAKEESAPEEPIAIEGGTNYIF
jgi:hypothetical protein